MLNLLQVYWAKPWEEGIPELAICLVCLIGMEMVNCEDTLIVLLYNLWLYTKMIDGYLSKFLFFL